MNRGRKQGGYGDEKNDVDLRGNAIFSLPVAQSRPGTRKSGKTGMKTARGRVNGDAPREDSQGGKGGDRKTTRK